ncbi:SAF domain-containing protein [Rhodococcus xishaensis]|uniref:Flagellar biosynthesis protein FlgA n=1 Tax=Rhodococcus xishaensis TaxID=2487364 RepID=A0A3S3AET1_9NOCA|nr:SAF domain-containing protein [Rhodococcus xishaensis]RVW02944.1 flagellar biosynthesis protein FlgA [Rhodococcus xishaensis]
MPRDVFRRRDAGSLAPTLGGRIGRLVRPDWARADTVRRVAAGLLAFLALVMLIRDGRRETGEPVVVAARDLTPGHILGAEDVRTVNRALTEVPGGATRNQEEAVGRTVASPVRSGEILTDVRLLGPRLAEAAVGSSDARVVPVRLSDSGLAELIREGDRVDVLTVGRARDVDAQPAGATVLASAATVVLVAPEHPSTGRRDRVVMLALPAPAASAVAAASLTDAITVTLH